MGPMIVEVSPLNSDAARTLRNDTVVEILGAVALRNLRFDSPFVPHTGEAKEKYNKEALQTIIRENVAAILVLREILDTQFEW